MKSFSCPLCGGNDMCKETMDGMNGYVHYYCDTYKVNYLLADDIIDMYDNETREKILNLVTEHLLQSDYCLTNGQNTKWKFFYQPSYQTKETDNRSFVNVAELLKNYPKGVMDFVHRSLINLSAVYPNYGQEISAAPELSRILFDNMGIMEIMVDLGYLRHEKAYYVITAEGWKLIDELRKQEMVMKQGFIAMRFAKETDFIREAFRTAIRESGYIARIIDEKEHNNQIVPEILYEIERSKFMVVDLTVPNYGAYYEAGYAQALRKEVIICCRKKEFDERETKPHFDIAQKSMIIWEDDKDLVNRLKRRIEATVR